MAWYLQPGLADKKESPNPAEGIGGGFGGQDFLKHLALYSAPFKLGTPNLKCRISGSQKVGIWIEA